jgi:hypothetical protein
VLFRSQDHEPVIDPNVISASRCGYKTAPASIGT